MCNLLPAKGMSESELTAAIDHACDSLTVLYAARRGKALPTTVPGQVWAWCAGCGQRMVDTSRGADTCATCHKAQP
jgi:hypothetical protein